MTYQEVEDYLCNKVPMFQKHGKLAYKKDLSNTLKLASFFDNPQDKFKSIHIAGTNGKGSSAHMTAAILQAKGYKVGLYTSPHLHSFRERIKINGYLVKESFVVDFVGKCQGFIEKEKPSFFELTTIMAFDYFAQEQVDYGVVEVGLGGRLDCTNIITPELSVITNIGLDHIDILGNDITSITNEKAGIIKEGVPVCYQENDQEVVKVIEEVSEGLNSDSYLCKDDEVKAYENLIPLKGGHQLKNLSSVIKGLTLIEGIEVKNEDVLNAFKLMEKELKLSGRWEQIGEHPKVIFDTAHNESAFKVLLEQIAKEEFDKLYFVLAFMEDKEVSTVVNMLPKDANFYFASFKHPRALYATHLKEIAKSRGLEGDEYGKVQLAYSKALENAEKNDLVIITGSSYLAEEIHKFG